MGIGGRPATRSHGLYNNKHPSQAARPPTVPRAKAGRAGANGSAYEVHDGRRADGGQGVAATPTSTTAPTLRVLQIEGYLRRCQGGDQHVSLSMRLCTPSIAEAAAVVTVTVPVTVTATVTATALTATTWHTAPS